MKNSNIKAYLKEILPLALGLGLSVGLQAGSLGGTLGFVDIGSPSCESTGSINTCTSFSIGNLYSTTGTGSFAGLPSQALGSVSFNTGNNDSLSFGDATLGNFNSDLIEIDSSSPGGVSYYIAGTFTCGTYEGGCGVDASFVIDFTQVPANTGQISDSGVLTIPAATAPSGAAPEPGFMTLMGLGLAVAGAFRRRIAALASR